MESDERNQIQMQASTRGFTEQSEVVGETTTSIRVSQLHSRCIPIPETGSYDPEPYPLQVQSAARIRYFSCVRDAKRMIGAHFQHFNINERSIAHRCQVMRFLCGISHDQQDGTSGHSHSVQRLIDKYQLKLHGNNAINDRV